MKQGVRSILLRVKAEGQGIVNFDGGHQKKISAKEFFNVAEFEGGIPNNVSYAKKIFREVAVLDALGNPVLKENGEPKTKTTYKIMVSSSAVTHEIFNQEFPFSAQDISIVNFARLLYLSSRTAIIRGYVLADKTISLKRKGAVTLPDFIQSNDVKSSMVVGTSKGARDSNSLFYKEHVGEIEYESNGGSIDLKQLQFGSVDYRHDRESVTEADFEAFKENVQDQFPTFKSEIQYFIQKGSKIFLPERGFTFDNTTVVELVKFYLKNLLYTNILRKSAFFKVSGIQIKYVYDPLVDTYGDENDWVDLDLETINKMDFQMHDFYDVVDTEEAIALLKPLDESKDIKKEAKKAAKDKKAAETKAYKEKVNATKEAKEA